MCACEVGVGGVKHGRGGEGMMVGGERWRGDGGGRERSRGLEGGD